MNILFVITSKKLPSGMVRVVQYLSLLDAASVQYEVLEVVSPLSISLEQCQQHLLKGDNLVRKCLRHSITRLCKTLNWLRRKRIYLDILSSAKKYDVIFFQWMAPDKALITKLRKQNLNVVYDFDDAVFLLEPEKAEHIIKNSLLVIAGSHYNYEYARQFNQNVVIIPSSVPLENYVVKATPAPSKGAPFCLGWIGSTSTMKYLKGIEVPLKNLAALGYRLELLVAGSWNNKRDLPEIEGVAVTEVPFYSGTDIPKLVAKMDIGLMPIDDTPWERGKCAMKALIYMAGAKPVVSSKVGEVCHIIDDGENGFLADSSKEWFDKLKMLLDSSDLREKTGLRGRETVERSFSTDSCFNRLHAALSNLADKSNGKHS